MISLKTFDHGYKYLEIENEYAEAKIALQGAHLFHYKSKDKPPLLWLSKLAYFEHGKAIRGGIPICFPWFGKNEDDSSLPQHGFGRTQMWKVVLEEELDDGSTRIKLQLTPNTFTLRQWNYMFIAVIDIHVGKEMSVALEVVNTDTKPFSISTALHTYFNVSNIDHVSITGLDNTFYYNNLDGNTYTQQGDIFIQEEVDRIYSNPSKNVSLSDDTKKVSIQQEGSHSMVIWNPWIEKSNQMADMPDDGYKTMVCVETSNAKEDSRVIYPNETHILKAIFSQETFV